jgi:hypothetical protein
MMMKRVTKWIVSGAALSATLGLASLASADNGPRCNTARERRQYVAGFAAGVNLTDMVFNVLDVAEDPDNLDVFIDQLREAIRQAARASFRAPTEASMCRVQGMIDGMSTELGTLQSEVLTECRFEGRFWGRLSAGLYCGILEDLPPALVNPNSLPLRIDRPNVGLCGTQFQTSCERGFNSLARGPNGEDEACYEFAEGDFEDLYETTRFNQCTYEPEIPE